MAFWLLLFCVAAESAVLDYKDGAFPSEIVESKASAGRREETVTFPSPAQSPFKINDTVWGHLSVPSTPGKHPCILVLPVMAAPNIWIEQRFINRFVREGFAVMWLEMPYQFHRRPHPLGPSGQVFLARTGKRLAGNFRQSVLDARRALSWLSKQPGIDPKRIGLFGISLGSLVGSVVYSVDPIPKYAVFLLGGADFPSLLENSSMTGPFVRKSEISADSLRQAFKGIDPLDYSRGNGGKEVLLINAESDDVIPKANGLKLKAAFPQALQRWVPLGHYSAILHLIWLPGFVARDFISHL